MSHASFGDNVPEAGCGTFAETNCCGNIAMKGCVRVQSNQGTCVVTGTRSNNRPVQPLGTRIVNFFQDTVNHTMAASA